MKPVARDVRAVTTVEFALVSTILMVMIFGCVELGLIMWTRGTLQAIAAQTARCAAINSPVCNTSPTTPRSYAVSQAATLLGTGLITAGDVSITTGTTCLSGSAGSTIFEIVTITATPWVGVSASGRFGTLGPLAPATETVTACYPT
jgi:Flp pilus assembly protein TadG